MAKNNIVKVGGELKSIAADGVVAGAEAIYDYNESKLQATINQELKQAIEDIDVTDQISGKADKSEMSVVAGTGADADKTTITLKSGTSATVLTQHQNISGKQDTISSVTVAVDDNTGTPVSSVTFTNNTLAFSFQNLKGPQGIQGVQGPQGIQGERGAEGAAGITGDASALNIRQAVEANPTTPYTATDVAGAVAVQYILTHEIEGGFYV